MADNEPGKWVTLSEAAHYFKVSERTLRRRIARGELRTERDGGRVLVLVYGLADNEADTPATSDTSAELDKLAAEVRRLSDLLSQVEGERDFLRSALATAMQNEQRLIEAGQAAPERDAGPLARLRRWWRGG